MHEKLTSNISRINKIFKKIYVLIIWYPPDKPKYAFICETLQEILSPLDSLTAWSSNAQADMWAPADCPIRYILNTNNKMVNIHNINGWKQINKGLAKSA